MYTVQRMTIAIDMYVYNQNEIWYNLILILNCDNNFPVSENVSTESISNSMF